MRNKFFKCNSKVGVQIIWKFYLEALLHGSTRGADVTSCLKAKFMSCKVKLPTMEQPRMWKLPLPTFMVAHFSLSDCHFVFSLC